MHGKRWVLLNEAIREAERFLEKANIAKNKLAEVSKSKHKPYQIYEFASVKRSSLDLSQKLSELRKVKVHD